MATYAWVTARAVVGSHRSDSNECRHRGDLGIASPTARKNVWYWAAKS